MRKGILVAVLFVLAVMGCAPKWHPNGFYPASVPTRRVDVFNSVPSHVKYYEIGTMSAAWISHEGAVKRAKRKAMNVGGDAMLVTDTITRDRGIVMYTVHFAVLKYIK
ncbi:MAG: hypothetical protein A2219_04290 [Elusimicrobia bacterium RIFOXYA2_FULL_50_26]|nr:MAG: hypothetical protein A2219_04290 [Elusimicrobia bacterium RIFOXYA2_FULL_50_26]OGS24973.1 MAG: hypothetical protein A2314_00190 [Elusimicrobia bacterium RIFOXYB2_FULL_50_12]